MDILWELKTAETRATRQESRLARFLLDNLRFASGSTIQQLALQAGVSVDTLIRFARSVGYDDMNHFMQQLRASAIDENSVAPAISGDLDYATIPKLEKLAGKAGVAPEMLRRFARSLGREDFHDILFQIRRGLYELSQQESRVAHAVLADITFASSASIEQLAARAGVSPATITRFAKSVGCEDIRDMRMKLAQASASTPHVLPDNAGKALPAGWQETFQAVNSALSQQINEADPDTCQRIGTCLQQARNVTIFASGTEEMPFALALQHRLLQAGIITTLCQDSSLIRMTAAALGSAQVLLVLATGTAAETTLQTAILHAQQRGAQIIALAAAHHPLATIATFLLPLPDSLQQGRYAMLLAIDLLMQAVTGKKLQHGAG